MTGFNHTLAGSIIAALVPAPLVPFVAFMSHFVLDAMPHLGDHPSFTHIPKVSKPLKMFLVGDTIVSIGITILWLIARPDLAVISLVSIFFSLLPDFMWIFKHQLRTPKWFIAFGSKIQWGEFRWGWWLELVYAGYMTYILVGLA